MPSLSNKRSTCTNDSISCAYWECSTCGNYSESARLQYPETTAQVREEEPACSHGEQPQTTEFLKHHISTAKEQLKNISAILTTRLQERSTLTKKISALELSHQDWVSTLKSLDRQLAMIDGRYTDIKRRSPSKGPKTTKVSKTQIKKLLSKLTKEELTSLMEDI